MNGTTPVTPTPQVHHVCTSFPVMVAPHTRKDMPRPKPQHYTTFPWVSEWVCGGGCCCCYDGQHNIYSLQNVVPSSLLLLLLQLYTHICIIYSLTYLQEMKSLRTRTHTYTYIHRVLLGVQYVVFRVVQYQILLHTFTQELHMFHTCWFLVLLPSGASNILVSLHRHGENLEGLRINQE